MAERIVESIQYGGITFPSIVHSEESVCYAHRNFEVRDSDVFNVTYPKSGTTWMQEILTLIYSNGDPTFSQSTPCWERMPWVEHKTTVQYLENRPSPRLITSHLPATIFPEKFFSSQAKVIYTVRDPRDVCVSLYHYTKMTSFLEYREDFGEFIELFSAGKILFGTWFDHVKSWLAYKNEKKFLLLVYDELLKDLRGSVLHICEFLGKNLDPAVVDSVVENASFGVMKNNKMVNYTLVSEHLLDQKISTFLRKGISGDWKNHFTKEQSAAFYQLYQENMNGLETKFPWDEFQVEKHQES
ncbi:sulfotransferase 2B1-like isoform X1 [Pantherophis guttatus]|uniref:Sulfotransferase n=1 Tax=Pantherophis guttatus TaxID=94885 RepID=A0A6P9C6D0_PANGU|nr:sulfotransferase 2B1-like isoform X1 [Pantherophis guttatus]XP_034275421.1 sulfotransferase 2B1-like isoform X1 [Pantherophis guttatus]XP_034275422.1 sulfotransferase 2B1-like isoform X1 [Pantherophis guttatus]